MMGMYNYAQDEHLMMRMTPYYWYCEWWWLHLCPTADHVAEASDDYMKGSCQTKGMSPSKDEDEPLP